MKYQIDGLLKFYEKDNYENGCDPDSGGLVDVTVSFSGKTPEDVIKQAAEWLGIEEDGIERNACDEPGRIDFAKTENDDSYDPSPDQMRQFKAGEIDLWYVVYTAHVEKVERVTL